MWAVGVTRWFQPSSGLPRGIWLPVSLLCVVPLYGGLRCALWLGNKFTSPLDVMVYGVVLFVVLVLMALWMAFCRRQSNRTSVHD
ncbi:hypothetical protein GCM10027030_23070 [Luteococcus sediminum]